MLTRTPADEELMLAAGGGDLAAFGQLVERHQAVVWRLAYRFLGDACEAEDVAQDAFLRILDAAPRYRPAAAFRTYLCRVVTRLCLDRAQKKRHVYTPAPPEQTDGKPAPPDLLAERERQQAVRQALETLPSRQRMAVVLRYDQGFSYSEIAAALDVTPKAVERLLARGRETLGRLLGRFLD
jgi:RNA polymerase sigma-70 factor (ECF subfamily)